MISLSKSLKKVGSLGSRRGLGFFSSFRLWVVAGFGPAWMQGSMAVRQRFELGAYGFAEGGPEAQNFRLGFRA